MADNVTGNPGSGGATWATDEVNTGGGNAHVQLVKLLSATDGSTERIGGDAANGLDVDITRIAAGTNAIGNVGVTLRTSGGPTIHRNINPGTTATSVKASAGQIGWVYCATLATTPRFLKLYNSAGTPTHSDTPALTLPIPSPGTTNGAGFVLSIPGGIPFATGIAYRVSTGIADNDTGAPTANDTVIALGYS